MNNTTPHIPRPLSADLPLSGTVPFGLPSVLFLAGWVLLVLALAGPFLVLLTIGLATALIVAIFAATVALPYLLVRSLLRYWERRVGERHPEDHGSPSERRGSGPVSLPHAQVPATAQLYTAGVTSE